MGLIDEITTSCSIKRFDEEIVKLGLRQKELKMFKDDLSNELINGVNAVFNLNDLYFTSDIYSKQRLIGSIFSRKVIFDKNKVRADQINEVIRWIVSLARLWRKIKQDNLIQKSSCPAW